MAVSLNVPVEPSAFYSVSIEQKPYQFTFRWQRRTQAWYLTVETSSGVFLSKSVKLVPNSPLFRQNLHLGPSGQLFVHKAINDSTQIPGRNNIGPSKDFNLIYFTAEELAG